MITTLKEVTSKAQKEYRCMLCGCKIEVGQTSIPPICMMVLLTILSLTKNVGILFKRLIKYLRYKIFQWNMV